MANGNWVCFDCRESVRRPTRHAGDVPCPLCGQRCRFLRTKLPIPSKRSVKAWQALRERAAANRVAALERAWVAMVRLRSKLEKELADLEARPADNGRTERIRVIRQRLADL
jgi:hypothetical protein